MQRAARSRTANSNSENSEDDDHQDRPAAEPVGEPAEDEGAERPRGKRQEHRLRDRLDVGAEFLRDRESMNTSRKKSKASSVQPR